MNAEQLKSALEELRDLVNYNNPEWNDPYIMERVDAALSQSEPASVIEECSVCGSTGMKTRYRTCVDCGVEYAVDEDINTNAADWRRCHAVPVNAQVSIEDLPPLPEGDTAYVKCDSCDGTGEDGMRPGNYFEPPEPYRCSHCDGSGRVSFTAYGGHEMRNYALAAIRALSNEPVKKEQL